MAMFYKITIFYLHAVRMRGCGVSREPSREKPIQGRFLDNDLFEK